MREHLSGKRSDPALVGCCSYPLQGTEIDAISKGAPNAVAAAKRLVREIPRLAPDDAYAVAAEKIAKLFASAEAAEGLAAFAQKRPPSWIEADDD